MRSIVVLLLAVGLSQQQEESSDVPELCSTLSVIHYKIFPLSSELKNNYCKGEKHVCTAFEMFASNDFAKAVVRIKEKLGCYPDRPSAGMIQDDLCNHVRALPHSSGKSLFELFSHDAKRMATFKPLLNEMLLSTEQWVQPILDQFC